MTNKPLALSASRRFGISPFLLYVLPVLCGYAVVCCVAVGGRAENPKRPDAGTHEGAGTANATEQTGADQTGFVNAAVNALSNINYTQVLPWGFMPLMGLQMFLAWWRDVKEIRQQRYVITMPKEIAEIGMRLVERLIEAEWQTAKNRNAETPK